MSSIEYFLIFKALASSLWLGITLAILGILILTKKMAFFSDGIAHATILALAIAFLFNLNLFLISFIFVVFLTILIFFLENKTKIHTDTIIGIVFVSSLSLGLILMSQKASYQPELLNFILGNILIINNTDFFLTIIICSLILALLVFNLEKIMLSLIDPVEAKLKGLNPKKYQLLLYLLLALGIVLGIKISGVILVTAFLILPAATASLMSSSFKNFIFFTCLLTVFNIISGFFISFNYFLPLGASIVFVGSILFFLFFILKLILKI